jgi:hypothetical protein
VAGAGALGSDVEVAVGSTVGVGSAVGSGLSLTVGPGVGPATVASSLHAASPDSRTAATASAVTGVRVAVTSASGALSGQNNDTSMTRGRG